MATEEMKSEIKKTEQKQSPQVKDLPLPLPFKTCSFKVSIHCEGCKRKVKKILTTIEGVYIVDIDMKQQKVTVTGMAEPEFLLKRLLKAGKNADLLPEIPDPVENKPVDQKEKNNKKKKKEEKPEITDAATSSSGPDKPKSEKSDVAGDCSSGDVTEICDLVKDEKKEILEKRDSIPETSPVPVDSPSPETGKEKKVDESSGNIGKKKKTKGQKTSSINNPTVGPVRIRSVPPPSITVAGDQDRPCIQNDDIQTMTNNNTPRQNVYPYAPNYYMPQIMYGASYNVAQPPVSVDGASYYSPTPPNSYAYMHPGYLPYDQNPYPYRPSDSFELFSDENPNGCSVM